MESSNQVDLVGRLQLDLVAGSGLVNGLVDMPHMREDSSGVQNNSKSNESNDRLPVDKIITQHRQTNPLKYILISHLSFRATSWRHICATLDQKSSTSLFDAEHSGLPKLACLEI